MKSNTMKRSELVRKLNKGGWQIIPGGKHGMATHQNHPGTRIPVPNSSKIDYWTAMGILKDTGLA